MYSSLQNCLEAGKQAFETGNSRTVPSNFARMDMAAFAFLKGFDEMQAEANRKRNRK